MPPRHRFLWLLRHAKTVTDPPAGGSDFDRVLAPRGRRDAKALGHVLGGDPGRLHLEKIPFPELVLVSPAVRTTATAELVLAELSTPPPCEFVPAFYGAEPEGVLEHLRSVDDGVTSVMVVGHNPTAHALANGLVRSDDKKGRDLLARRGFPTCSLGVYRFTLDHWSKVGARGARVVGFASPPFAQK